MIVCYHILQQHFKPSIYTSTINVLKRSTISDHKVATFTGLQGKDGNANESMVMGRNALLTINLSGLGLKHSIKFSFDLQLTFHYSYHN